MRVIITHPRTFFSDGSFRIWISVSGPYGPKSSFSKQNPLLVEIVAALFRSTGSNKLSAYVQELEKKGDRVPKNLSTRRRASSIMIGPQSIVQSAIELSPKRTDSSNKMHGGQPKPCRTTVHVRKTQNNRNSCWFYCHYTSIYNRSGSLNADLTRKIPTTCTEGEITFFSCNLPSIYNTITGAGTSHHRFETNVINEETILIFRTLVLKPNTHAVDIRHIDVDNRILILVGC